MLTIDPWKTKNGGQLSIDQVGPDEKDDEFGGAAREFARPFDSDPPDVRLRALEKVAWTAKWRTNSLVP